MEVEGSDGLARMRILNEQSKLTAEQACEKLGLDLKKNVLGLYLYGSRLWGTANAGSDYDFLVIVKKADKPCATMHRGNLDCMIMTEAEYLRRLQAHSFLCVAVTCWLPDAWCWKTYRPKKPFALNKKTFVQAVLDEAERDWATARKRRDKGLRDAADKVEMHAVRMLRVAQQLMGGNDAPDLACALDVWQTLKDDYDGSYARQYLQEEKDRLVASLRAVVE